MHIFGRAKEKAEGYQLAYMCVLRHDGRTKLHCGANCLLLINVCLFPRGSRRWLLTAEALCHMRDVNKEQTSV